LNSSGLTVAMSESRVVCAASAVIMVNDSRVWSQNSVTPPKPRHFDIEKT
jgi:hypothetical protein